MTSVPTTRPPNGFMKWVSAYGHRDDDPRPYDYEVVETWREGVMATDLVEPHKMHPAQNVAGLYWRPVKMFGEEQH